MSKYVSKNQPRGYVNYEELIKFLAQCLGKAATVSSTYYQDYANAPSAKYQQLNSNYELASDADYVRNAKRYFSFNLCVCFILSL
jgi:hypothetical protein